jgi:hypothetical protein
LYPLRGGESVKIVNLLNDNTYKEALEGWGEPSERVRLGQKIRINREGLPTKTGYAYKEKGAWLGIRYTWRSMRWWSLLNYNNPLIKLEAQELDGEGNAYWITLWERGK